MHKALGVDTGDLLRINTEIGYFVDKVWVTEGMKPGVVACSHHLGRWRRPQDVPANRWATNTVKIDTDGQGGWSMKTITDIQPFESKDADSARIFWSDGGVHQNITFPVHPDPISGMHCWHQKVRLEKALPGDTYGDIFVDTKKSFEVYKKVAGTGTAGARAERAKEAAVVEESLKTGGGDVLYRGVRGGYFIKKPPSEITRSPT